MDRSPPYWFYSHLPVTPGKNVPIRLLLVAVVKVLSDPRLSYSAVGHLVLTTI